MEETPDHELQDAIMRAIARLPDKPCCKARSDPKVLYLRLHAAVSAIIVELEKKLDAELAAEHLMRALDACWSDYCP